MNGPRSGRVDAHRHVWDPARGDYPWMPQDGPLRRPYLVDELQEHARAARLDGTVVVQAAPTIDETLWLLELAEQSDGAIVGVVGWVDLEADDVLEQIDRVQHPLLVGIRPMIQDMPDDRWVQGPAVAESLPLLADRGLVFDVLGYTRHLPHVMAAVERSPDLRVVVNHLAKPEYDRVDPEWVEWISVLAARPHTYVKISGMATEVEGAATSHRFQRHVDFVLERFTPARSMLGTDWPVGGVAMPYSDTLDLLGALVAHLDVGEQAAVWGSTCVSAYKLAMSPSSVGHVRRDAAASAPPDDRGQLRPGSETTRART